MKREKRERKLKIKNYQILNLKKEKRKKILLF